MRKWNVMGALFPSSLKLTFAKAGLMARLLLFPYFYYGVFQLSFAGKGPRASMGLGKRKPDLKDC